jgi:hypothetical protein
VVIFGAAVSSVDAAAFPEGAVFPEGETFEAAADPGVADFGADLTHARCFRNWI